MNTDFSTDLVLKPIWADEPNLSTDLVSQPLWPNKMEATFSRLLKNHPFGKPINWQSIAKKIEEIFKVKISEEFYQNKWEMNKDAYPLKFSRAWTKSDDQDLINLIRIYGYNWQEISQKLNRTVGSLQQHYRLFFLNTFSPEEKIQIELIFVKEKKVCYQWTLEKNQQLIDYVKQNGMNLVELSRLLDHTQAAIYKHFRKLMTENDSLSKEFPQLKFYKTKKRQKLEHIVNNRKTQNTTNKEFFNGSQSNLIIEPIRTISINSLANKKDADPELSLLWENIESCLPLLE